MSKKLSGLESCPKLTKFFFENPPNLKRGQELPEGEKGLANFWRTLDLLWAVETNQKINLSNQVGIPLAQLIKKKRDNVKLEMKGLIREFVMDT